MSEPERTIHYHPDLDPDKIYAPKGWLKVPMPSDDLSKIFVGSNCLYMTNDIIKFSKEAIKTHTAQFPVPRKTPAKKKKEVSK